MSDEITVNDFNYGKLKNPDEWQTEGNLTIYGRVVEIQDRAFKAGESFTNLRMQKIAAFGEKCLIP